MEVIIFLEILSYNASKTGNKDWAFNIDMEDDFPYGLTDKVIAKVKAFEETADRKFFEYYCIHAKCVGEDGTKVHDLKELIDDSDLAVESIALIASAVNELKVKIRSKEDKKEQDPVAPECEA